MKKSIVALAVLVGLLLVACTASVSSPPLIRLVADDTLIDGFQGPYCWAPAAGPALCVDPIPPEFDTTTSLPASEPIRLQLDKPLPDSVRLSLSEELFGEPVTSETVSAAETLEWSPQVAPGPYILRVEASWTQGDVAYWFSISLD